MNIFIILKKHIASLHSLTTSHYATPHFEMLISHLVSRSFTILCRTEHAKFTGDRQARVGYIESDKQVVAGGGVKRVQMSRGGGIKHVGAEHQACVGENNGQRSMYKRGREEQRPGLHSR